MVKSKVREVGQGAPAVVEGPLLDLDRPLVALGYVVTEGHRGIRGETKDHVLAAFEPADQVSRLGRERSTLFGPYVPRP